MSVWKCPVCGSFMQHRGKSWSCAQGHNFDMAKSGYVNLLPVNRKHAKNPGDNAVMMRARKNFLDAGHYALLLQALDQKRSMWSPDVDPLLEKCTVAYHEPSGHEITIIYGDYYFIEAVMKLSGQELFIW